MGNRHRKEIGEITPLEESFRQDGFLQPIGVTKKLEIDFGEQRWQRTDIGPSARISLSLGRSVTHMTAILKNRVKRIAVILSPDTRLR